MSTSAAPAKTNIRQTGVFRSFWNSRSATKRLSMSRCFRISTSRNTSISIMIRLNASPAVENPEKVPDSATMAGSSSLRCSASNTAYRSTSIRPEVCSSEGTVSITLTERIRKNRQENRGLIQFADHLYHKDPLCLHPCKSHKISGKFPAKL